MDGRHSTPLHFAAGYNRVGVVEFLLQHGADVHAKDKGGLVRRFGVKKSSPETEMNQHQSLFFTTKFFLCNFTIFFLNFREIDYLTENKSY